MAYFVFAKTASQLQVNLNELSLYVKEYWVVVEEDVNCQERFGGYWKIRFGVYDLEFTVSKELRSIAIDSDLIRAIQFAFWFRRFIPAEIPLVLYDDSGEEFISLDNPYDEIHAINYAYGKLSAWPPP